MHAPGTRSCNGAADERVVRIRPLGDAREHEPGGRFRRQILRGVHRDVGAAVEHRVLHFLREHALPADRVQVGGLVAVAGGA